MPDLMQQLAIMRHALGAGEHGWDKPHRNHYVTGPDGRDHATCMELVENGLMARRPGNILTGGDDLFTVTDIGRAAVAAAADPKPKLTRAQRRYQAYLDSDSDLRFGEWLRSHYAREVHYG
ncbi:hypothetical protein [Pseudomonas sp.]|uniref:hypothetical protein n=1 Tax=Pseudomonas sp. TaxID=306 RepID=UPI003D109373